MTGSAIRKIAGRFSESAIDDEIVLMRLDNGDFFSLSGTSRLIWELIDGERDLAQIGAMAAAQYAVPATTIADDIADFVSALIEAGLVAQG